MRRILVPLFLLAVLAAGACSPRVALPGPDIGATGLSDDAVIAPDGARLPLHRWLPEDGTPPRAVILAVHGFNDYGRFFDMPGTWFAGRGIASYAYDQRGFGGSPNRGLWAGTEAMTADLAAAARLLRGRHPGVPLFLLGASMGGAVILAAEAAGDAPPADGLILSAPAVWGYGTMPLWQRWSLWVSAHTVPWMTLTGRGLKRQASDNIPMLRGLAADPLVIKETRIDAVYGLTRLMDTALAAAPRVGRPSLVLYGGNDQIIPAGPVDRLIAGLPDSRATVIRYPTGYHMLLRDLEAERTWRDILDWMTGPVPDPAAPGSSSPPHSCRRARLKRRRARAMVRSSRTRSSAG